MAPNLSSDAKALAAEFVATTLFVWVACGTAVTAQSMEVFSPGTTNDNSFLTAVAFAFGLAIVALVYTVAPVSGGHLNPAVTLAFVMLGEMPLMKGIFYAIAQSCGAILGAALVWGSTASDTLKLASDEKPPFLLGSNSVQEDLPLGAAFLGEAMGTFLLVWTVLMTAVSKKSIAANIAPLAIGISVLLSNLMLIPLTGCGINPARTLGPHLVVFLASEEVSFNGWWVYYTAPFAGAIVAAFISQLLFDVTAPEESAPNEGGGPTETTPLVQGK